MDWIYLFTNFNGRISRQPFWIAFAIFVVAQLLVAKIENNTLSVLLDLAVTYPEFAVSVKRSNDRNLPPWLVALFFAGNVALDLFMLLNGPLDPESTLGYLIFYPLGLLQIILLIEFGFRRGTEGPNRFGEDPLATGKPRLLHQYAIVRWLDGWQRALTPDEPFFRVRGPSGYQEQLPRSVKYWCFIITAVNALIFLFATIELRSFVPALVFALVTTVGPISLLLFWSRTTKHLNARRGKPRGAPTMLDQGFTLSAEWCAIIALIGTPLFMIAFILADFT